MAFNKTFLGYSIIILISGLVMLITSAMGVQCSNECEKYKKDNKGNHSWMSVVLGVSVLMVLISFGGFYLTFSGKGTIAVNALTAAGAASTIVPVVLGSAPDITGTVSTQLNTLNKAVTPDTVNSVITALNALNKAGTQ